MMISHVCDTRVRCAIRLRGPVGEACVGRKAASSINARAGRGEIIFPQWALDENRVCVDVSLAGIRSIDTAICRETSMQCGAASPDYAITDRQLTILTAIDSLTEVLGHISGKSAEND